MARRQQERTARAAQLRINWRRSQLRTYGFSAHRNDQRERWQRYRPQGRVHPLSHGDSPDPCKVRGLIPNGRSDQARAGAAVLPKSESPAAQLTAILLFAAENMSLRIIRA